MLPPVAGSRLAQILFVRIGALMVQPVHPATLQLAGEASPVFEGVGPGLNTGFFRFSVSGDGSLTFQAVPALPLLQLTWFDRNGGQAGVVGQPGYMSSFSISPDGKKVALTRYRSTNPSAGSDIWLNELGRGSESRFSLKKLHNISPVWSPDGNSIVYGVANGVYAQGQWEVYQKHTNGTGQEELLAKGDSRLVPVSWSRDGRFVTLSSSNGTGSSICWCFRSQATGSLCRLWPASFRKLRASSLQTASGWLTLRMNRAGSRFMWSLFHEERGRRASGQCQPLEARNRAGGRTAKSCSTSTQAVGCSLFRSRIAVRNRVSLWARRQCYSTRGFHGTNVGWVFLRRNLSYDIAPDGKRFLVRAIREHGVEAPLVLVTNWQALLK